ncbi:tumor necrosis factor receptor superfamily member 27 isoform X1 [Falco biarmicus]|uniref:tumor necrosis factor receptor superfamily member 27 n=1 Tax=Falco rusticolus TaxID=120794 RepID=UPI000392F4C2|nr:tumor necrosis factor receptor superfamily member 27 [Falco rusticolus]XP_055583663.1 tumor necrosis factor receptor superfamily member 27 isoform X1 [Falco cherrug]XP_056215977.1 tumor necrosis factor receptor superfamily member 27 isoform X1 [Falco biarmicus]
MDCQESEYLDEHRKCIPCRKCMPGQELSKDCADSGGGDVQCVACPPRKFKDSWGHHGCKPCLSCALINRIQKSNCTSTTNAVCGECLPGFYRKARISGQLDWECIPCTKQTPSSEPQCRSRTNLVKVAVPTVPPQDTALLALTSSALVIIVLVLLALSIIYCKRFWKSQCQRVFLRTQNFSGQRAMFPTMAQPSRFLCEEQMSGPCCLGVKNLSPCYRQAEGPVEAVQFISDGEAVGLQLPSLQLEMDLPLGVTVSAASKAQLGRGLLESQPLIRASGCGDCLAGVLLPSDPRQGQLGMAEALAPLSSCASEMQHKWPHAPVECTELDLQKFSSQAEFAGSERPEEAASQAAQRVPAESSGVGQQGAQCPPSTFANPTAESGEQPVDDAQSLVTQISSTAKGLLVAELPHSLVQSLAFLLDPSLNSVKNFSHVALELGVAPQLLGRIPGFEQLVAHFAYSGDAVTIPLLAQALQRLQRFDALLLLCDHFVLSQAQGHQC